MNDKDKDAWRAELERRGLENVKLKLLAAGVGRGASVRGFEHPSEIPRDFVEDRESSRPRSILCETPARDLRSGQASPRTNSQSPAS